MPKYEFVIGPMTAEDTAQALAAFGERLGTRLKYDRDAPRYGVIRETTGVQAGLEREDFEEEQVFSVGETTEHRGLVRHEARERQEGQSAEQGQAAVRAIMMSMAAPMCLLSGRSRSPAMTMSLICTWVYPSGGQYRSGAYPPVSWTKDVACITPSATPAI